MVWMVAPVSRRVAAEAGPAARQYARRKARKVPIVKDFAKRLECAELIADFQSASAWTFRHLPTGSRRHSRFEICATSGSPYTVHKLASAFVVAAGQGCAKAEPAMFGCAL